MQNAKGRVQKKRRMQNVKEEDDAAWRRMQNDAECKVGDAEQKEEEDAECLGRG